MRWDCDRSLMNHGGGESFASQIVGKLSVPRLVRAKNEAPAGFFGEQTLQHRLFAISGNFKRWTRTFRGLSTDPNARRTGFFM